MNATEFLASIGAKFATPEEHAAAVKAVGEMERAAYERGWAGMKERAVWVVRAFLGGLEKSDG